MLGICKLRIIKTTLWMWFWIFLLRLHLMPRQRGDLFTLQFGSKLPPFITYSTSHLLSLSLSLSTYTCKPRVMRTHKLFKLFPISSRYFCKFGQNHLLFDSSIDQILFFEMQLYLIMQYFVRIKNKWQFGEIPCRKTI